MLAAHQNAVMEDGPASEDHDLIKLLANARPIKKFYNT